MASGFLDGWNQLHPGVKRPLGTVVRCCGTYLDVLWSAQGFQCGHLKLDPETDTGLQPSGGELAAGVKELEREKY